MTSLQECLYQYISEKQYPVLQNDPEYVSAEQIRNEAEKMLLAGLTEEQLMLFIQYTDEESHLLSLHLRHLFQETLRMAHGIFFPQ